MSSYVPVDGDYVFLDGEWLQIERVLYKDVTPFIICLNNYADYYIQPWMEFVPKAVFNSPLYKALL